MAVTSASEVLCLHYVRGWRYGENVRRMVRKKARDHGGVPGSLKCKSFNNPLIRPDFLDTIIIFLLATAWHHTGNQASCMGTLYGYITNHAQTADSVKYLFNFLKLFLMFLIMGICP